MHQVAHALIAGTLWVWGAPPTNIRSTFNRYVFVMTKPEPHEINTAQLSHSPSFIPGSMSTLSKSVNHTSSVFCPRPHRKGPRSDVHIAQTPKICCQGLVRWDKRVVHTISAEKMAALSNATRLKTHRPQKPANPVRTTGCCHPNPFQVRASVIRRAGIYTSNAERLVASTPMSLAYPVGKLLRRLELIHRRLPRMFL